MTFVSLFETETVLCCTGEDGTTELWVLNTVEHLLAVLLPTVPLRTTVLEVVIIV